MFLHESTSFFTALFAVGAAMALAGCSGAADGGNPENIGAQSSAATAECDQGNLFWQCTLRGDGIRYGGAVDQVSEMARSGDGAGSACSLALQSIRSQHAWYKNRTASIVEFHTVNKQACENEIRATHTACLPNGTVLSDQDTGFVLGQLFGGSGPQLKAYTPPKKKGEIFIPGLFLPYDVNEAEPHNPNDDVPPYNVDAVP